MFDSTNGGSIRVHSTNMNYAWEAEMIGSDSPTAQFLRAMMKWTKERVSSVRTIIGASWIDPDECHIEDAFDLDGVSLSKAELRQRFNDVLLLMPGPVTILKLTIINGHVIYNSQAFRSPGSLV